MVVDSAKPLFTRCDMHVHTHLSPCGWSEMMPAAIIRAAVRQGVEHLAITDHMHPYTDPAILDRVRDDCRRIDSRVNVYIGCEADVLDVGKAVVDSALAEKTDFIMVSANHFHEEFVAQPKTPDRPDVARHFIRMLEYAVGIEEVDVIAHPLYVMPGTFDPLSPSLLTEDDLLPVIELAVKNKVAFEISRRALDPLQNPFLMRFYRLCKQAGAKFSTGSDAHQLQDVGQSGRIEPIIRGLGLTDDDIWRASVKSKV